MSFEHFTGGFVDGNDSQPTPPLDLNTVFSHPAGLRTARHIVGFFIHMSKNNTSPDSFSTVATPMFDSSPDVKRQLGELLAFSSSTANPKTNLATVEGSLSTERRPVFSNTSVSPEDLLRAHIHPPSAAESTDSHSMVLQPLPRPATMNRPYSFDGMALPRPQNRLQPRQSTSPLTVDRTGSPMQGIESPYRVESPSGQSSGQAQRSNNASGPVLLEADPYQLESIPRYSPLSGPPAQSQVAGMGAFFQRQTSSGSNYNQRAQNDFNRRVVPQSHRESLTIKNFLPVNKNDNRIPGIVKQNGNSLEDGIFVDQINTRPQNTTPATSSSFTKFRSIEFRSPPNPPNTQPSETSPGLTMPARKRKDTASEPAFGKRYKTGTKTSKRVTGGKASEKRRKNVAVGQLSLDLWMRILEFSPPSFLKKARLISKDIKILVDEYDSILVNQRRENYGVDMPGPPPGLSERQYNDLLGGKGCMEPSCTDKLSSRAHWSWFKRWCTSCWTKKVQREDKIIKALQNQYGRNTVLQMLESIPSGMHDSFEKPHTSMEDGQEQERSSTAPRLYRCYLQSEVNEIVGKYDALTPAPYVEDPSHSAAEKAAALAAHQAEMQALDQKRIEFFETRKKANDEYMAKIRKIEECVRRRRGINGEPNEKNRQARRKLFTQRALEEIPHIPTAFVQCTACYRAATRIFRDPGTERGWQTLKPKIERDWAASDESKAAAKGAEIENLGEPSRPSSIERDVEFIRQQQVGDVGRHSNPYLHRQIQALGGGLPSSRTSSPGGYGQPGLPRSFAPSLMRESNSFQGFGNHQVHQQNTALPSFSHNDGQIGLHSTSGASYIPNTQAYHYNSTQVSQQASRPALPISMLLNGSPSGPSVNNQRDTSSSSFKPFPPHMFGHL